MDAPRRRDAPRQGHGPEDEPDEAEPDGIEQDGAERAFEALREEVAALRRGVELVYRQAQQAAPSGPVAPDYSPTLGAIAQELRAVGQRLDGVEGHPALRLMPAAYAQQVAAGVRQAGEEAGREARQVQGHLNRALGELRGLIGSAHSQFAQQRREIIFGAIGAALGLLAWYPLIFVIPWGGGHWLAGTLVAGSEWDAGWTLMQEANPAAADKVARLYKGCPREATTELCEAAMAARAASPSPTSVAAEGAGTPAFGTVPKPAHGKSGQKR